MKAEIAAEVIQFKDCPKCMSTPAKGKDLDTGKERQAAESDHWWDRQIH